MVWTQQKQKRRRWRPTPVLSPGKSHGGRSLMGYSPWGCDELDTTELLHFHFSLSCIGEGNGNPLQCSCLENPRDGGAWWAAVYGVAQSRTRLKRLSGNSSSSNTRKTRQENVGGDKAEGGAGRVGGCKELPSLHLFPSIFLLSFICPLTSSQAFPSYNQVVFWETSIIL